MTTKIAFDEAELINWWHIVMIGSSLGKEGFQGLKIFKIEELS